MAVDVPKFGRFISTCVYLHSLSPRCQRFCSRFLFSVSHLCLTVFHYFEQNICHGFWKLLFFISARVSWCTATFLCWFQCKCYTRVKVKRRFHLKLPKMPPHASVQTYFALYSIFFKIEMFPLGIRYFMFAISLCAISRLIEWVQNTRNKPK